MRKVFKAVAVGILLVANSSFAGVGVSVYSDVATISYLGNGSGGLAQTTSYFNRTVSGGHMQISISGGCKVVDAKVLKANDLYFRPTKLINEIGFSGGGSQTWRYTYQVNGGNPESYEFFGAIVQMVGNPDSSCTGTISVD
jgi:hypothetical protein